MNAMITSEEKDALAKGFRDLIARLFDEDRDDLTRLMFRTSAYLTGLEHRLLEQRKEDT